MYSDDELLMLSGIQHIAFCERQYALIYIENQWEENILTIQGHRLHERVDDPFESGKRNDIISLRSIYLVSYQLGLYGKADLIELVKTNELQGTLTLANTQGFWKVKPVEFKRGKPKPDISDEVQLCAQAICIEEMYQVQITEAEIFYGEPHRRKTIKLDENLRTLTTYYANRMHQLYSSQTTPKPNFLPKCKGCSLLGNCQPKAIQLHGKVKEYFEKNLNFDS
jgi:CRISPR-associated exonuclease Cas4